MAPGAVEQIRDALCCAVMRRAVMHSTVQKTGRSGQKGEEKQ
jgi:hypothetical protein